MKMLQQQARALGDPTRHAVFRYVADANRPIDVAELTEHFALNHNAIRQHLAKLVAAKLVVETKALPTLGRPRLVYDVDPTDHGQWGVTGPYERLSRLLLEIIRTGRSPQEVGRLAADELGVAAPSGDLVADMTAAMAQQGFEPELRMVNGTAEIILHNCPFEGAARADREVVCSLHLGIAEGLAEGTEGRVDELVAYDPRRAGCRVRVKLDDDSNVEGSSSRLTLRGRTPRR
jgi:predicted ArsR family transcriptional regulator